MLLEEIKKAVKMLRDNDFGPQGFIDLFPMAQNQEENAMRYCDTPTTTKATAVLVTAPAKEDAALRYIKDRIDTIFWHKRRDLEKTYIDLERPKNRKEALEWLKTKNYTIKIPEDQYEDSFDWYDTPFQWGKKIADWDTFYKSADSLDKAKQEAKDTINILTDEKARLDALKAFEGWTYAN